MMRKFWLGVLLFQWQLVLGQEFPELSLVEWKVLARTVQKIQKHWYKEPSASAFWQMVANSSPLRQNHLEAFSGAFTDSPAKADPKRLKLSGMEDWAQRQGVCYNRNCEFCILRLNGDGMWEQWAAREGWRELFKTMKIAKRARVATVVWEVDGPGYRREVMSANWIQTSKRQWKLLSFTGRD